MHKVENKSKEEIAKIGRKIGEEFAAEKAGIVTLLIEEQTVKAFEIMTDYFYRAGVLHSISETGEGYLAYWEKKTKPAIGPALHIMPFPEKALAEIRRVLKPDGILIAPTATGRR